MTGIDTAIVPLLVASASQSDWQSTAQALAAVGGAIGIVITLGIGFRQLGHLGVQTRHLEEEQNARLRPWLGVTGIHLLRKGETVATDGVDIPITPDHSLDRIVMLYQNVGALPAVEATLDMTLECKALPNLNIESPISEEQKNLLLGTVFPHEPSQYVVNVGPFWDIFTSPLSASARAEEEGFQFAGSVHYSSSNQSHVTRFQSFFHAKSGRFTSWRNTETK